MPSVYDTANDIFGILERHAAEKNVIGIDWNLLSATSIKELLLLSSFCVLFRCRNIEVTIELVDPIVWPFDIDATL